MLKKLVSGLCSLLILCLNFCANVSAFPGFFHYIVAEKILEEGPYKGLTKEESDALKRQVFGQISEHLFLIKKLK